MSSLGETEHKQHVLNSRCTPATSATKCCFSAISSFSSALAISFPAGAPLIFKSRETCWPGAPTILCTGHTASPKKSPESNNSAEKEKFDKYFWEYLLWIIITILLLLTETIHVTINIHYSELEILHLFEVKIYGD
mmetsp:Transcript_14107/g.15561  ORF Transcript_14107/g.15561 Transcript_14107/m.15561 type:complete len:136 (-) Transcript_14107:241-648(-)